MAFEREEVIDLHCITYNLRCSKIYDTLTKSSIRASSHNVAEYWSGPLNLYTTIPQQARATVYLPYAFHLT